MMLVLLIMLLLLALIGSLPIWPHSADWGYGPSGMLGGLLIIVLVALFL